MDLNSILVTASAVGTGLGGFIGGRWSARGIASDVASDTVEMLQTQVNLLKEDKEHRDLEILDLTQRVAVLEGLVTQRAEVEQVQRVVDRIAEKVGA